MDKDISKRTVLVLLILTLVISVVGTWTILSQPSTITKTTNIMPSPDGKVMVGIEAGPQQAVSQTAFVQPNSGGEVAIKILK